MTVNGRLVTELGAKIDPGRDRVCVDGRPIEIVWQKRYLALNKPTGHLSTRSDPRGRPTVYDLLGRAGRGLFSVGRLDKDTTGLLLLTNDGELAYRLMHPSFEVPKVYRATVMGVPDAEDVRRLAAGVELRDGPTSPAHLRILRVQGGRALVELTICEGRKRQVRRMLKHLGHAVTELHRAQIGPLRLGGVAPGHARELRADEAAALRRAVGLPALGGPREPPDRTPPTPG